METKKKVTILLQSNNVGSFDCDRTLFLKPILEFIVHI
jgi:hypothetical protein